MPNKIDNVIRMRKLQLVVQQITDITENYPDIEIEGKESIEFGNYPHRDFEEWLEENYNLYANELDKNELENYNNEFRNSDKGIYVGLKKEEIRMDVNLNLNNVEKIVDKLNSMKIKY